MVIRRDSFEKEIRVNMRSGSGEVEIINLMPAEYANEKCRLFAKVVIGQGSSIGLHTHIKEVETYYILSGMGTAYDETGTETVLSAGDGLYTGFGSAHSIKNTGSEDLVFIALILLD